MIYFMVFILLFFELKLLLLLSATSFQYHMQYWSYVGVFLHEHKVVPNTFYA